jgi:hypothetical protein
VVVGDFDHDGDLGTQPFLDRPSGVVRDVCMEEGRLGN